VQLWTGHENTDRFISEDSHEEGRDYAAHRAFRVARREVQGEHTGHDAAASGQPENRTKQLGEAFAIQPQFVQALFPENGEHDCE